MYCIVLPVLHAPSDLSCMCCCVGSQSQQMFKICTADPSLSLAGPHLVSCRAPCVVRLGFWLACGADPVVRGWLGTLCHILCFRLGCWLACGADPWGGGLACYPQPYLAASQAVPCCHCTAIYWQHICARVYTCCLYSALQLSAVDTWGQLLSLLLVTLCLIPASAVSCRVVCCYTCTPAHAQLTQVMEPAAWFTNMRGWEEELLLYVRIDIAVAWVVAHGPHTLFWQDATCVHVFGKNGRVRQGME